MPIWNHIVVLSILQSHPGEQTMIEDPPLTLSVPEAGKRYFGLCRNAAYDAAARGEIPTIKIGRLLRVPVRALEQMLDCAAARSRAS
jgi:Helix-turn-helix domain